MLAPEGPDGGPPPAGYHNRRTAQAHHRPGHEPAAPLPEPDQLRRAPSLPPRVSRPARGARRGRQRGPRCTPWPGRHAQRSLSCAARLPAPACTRLLSEAPRAWPTQGMTLVETTPTPQSEPVPQTSRRVAHDAPLVAIGSGLSIPAPGPAHSRHYSEPARFTAIGLSGRRWSYLPRGPLRV